MNWWNRFKEWLKWKWTGKRYVTGVDYGNWDKNVLVIGYVDRKGVLHIEQQIEFDEPSEIVKRFRMLGVSTEDFAKAMGNMAKMFPSVEDVMEATVRAKKEMLDEAHRKIVDNKIDVWHKDKLSIRGISGIDIQELHDFLGWTWEEYKDYVDKRVIPERTKMSYPDINNVVTKKGDST